ncbi:von Willebrand factor A domain-containing DDB_G0286969-like [Olea europaea subsp. europaea]|uniref:von Willebrand factor A domain-containing DDB_G0286969-like n=1 Tax=Olea europaea subsp. europaea TaxID=158383 RepID=A0A8S0PMB9_OLEEU|nr:von Willebrand factor A domain-containing DDB_G0286969-like [Olea europaea subsp. europaea]
MADGFEAAVEDGLRLSKRIYFGKDRAVAPPKPAMVMEREREREREDVHSYLPASPMIYAVIGNPAIVDNPDIPSYQPHVHGSCNPSALIPLQMNGISLEVECYLDTAFVTVTGSWRVHCVMGSRSCDCRLAVPMGEQGSILGVEVEVPRKSYSTQLIALDNERDTDKVEKIEDGGFLKPHIFTLTIPQVDGGTNLSVKFSWSQKLLYSNGQFTLKIPFNFPEYVTPAGKKMSKREKIQLNVNSVPGTEVLFKTTSHPLKEQRREAGKLAFSYESEVVTWSTSDFFFMYTISSNHTVGGVLLKSPSLLDVDQREMFCSYLFPGNQQNEKEFRKEVVFVIDISGSMREKPIEDTQSALFAALSKLDSEDLFGVIAFNDETHLFSSSMMPATMKAIENVTQWITLNFIAGGGTKILLPLNQAIGMLSNSSDSIPIIFLITDGSVEDERHICDVMKSQLTNQQKVCPRIYTLGIGSFCNHYFLRMLAIIGRGYHDVSYDADSIEVRIGRLFATAASVFLANISFEGLDKLDEIEVFPSRIPDLSSESPLIISGRYRGMFPETIKVKGYLADNSNFSLDLKVQEAKGIPIDRILAKQQIELLTSQAWYSENKELKEKIAKMSVQNAIVSEYTHLILHETERGRKGSESTSAQQVYAIFIIEMQIFLY